MHAFQHTFSKKQKSHAFIHAFKKARKNSHTFIHACIQKKSLMHSKQVKNSYVFIHAFKTNKKSKDEFLNNGFMTLSRTQSCISSEERTQSHIFTKTFDSICCYS